MTDSSRRRDLRQSQTRMDNSPTPKAPNLFTKASQIILLVFTVVCGFFAIKWLLSDVTGEYLCADPKLGNCSLSLIRRATNLEGQFTYGDGTTLTVLSGKGDGTKMSLSLANDSKTKKATLAGKMDDSVLAGTLTEESGGKYRLALRRDPLASMYRQVQEHLPHWPIKL